jgi:uncharacterized protein (DUF58 family)
MSPNLPRSRRTVGFTREGWYFVFIFGFIVFGSILRQINLLVVLAGMMIPALLFNWRMAIGMIRKVSIRHRCADWIFAGQTTTIELEVINDSAALAAWNIFVVDQIGSTQTPRSERVVKTVPLVAPGIPPQRTANLSYRCFFSDRGLYEIGPADVSCRFPFGLVKAQVRLRNTVDLYVAPPLGTLNPSWHKRMASIAIGTSSTERKRGFLPDEYYGIRNWTAGDSRRWIHWRSTAKRSELMVKQFDQPTDRDFALALDLYAEDLSDPLQQTAVESALSFVTTIVSKLNFAVHGRVAIAVCGDESFLYVNEIAGDFVRSIMQHLAIARPSRPTDLAKQLPQQASKVSRGTPVVLVTTRPPGELESLKLLWKADATSRVTDLNLLWVQIPSPEFDELFSRAVAYDLSELPTDQSALVSGELDD